MKVNGIWSLLAGSIVENVQHPLMTNAAFSGLMRV